MIVTQFRCSQCCLEFLMRVGGQLLAHAKRCALVTSFPSWQITVPGVIKFASLSTCCRQPLNLMHGILGRALMKARRSASNPIQSHVLGPSCLSFFSLQSRPRQRTRLCTPAVLDPLVSLPSRRHLLFSPLVSSQLRCHSLFHLLVLNSGATCWSLGQLSVHLSPGQGM